LAFRSKFFFFTLTSGLVQNSTASPYSPDVTFEHVAQAYSVDVVPNAFTIGTQTFATNDNTIWNGPAQQITGINQPITLRFQSYDPAGSMDAFAVHIYRDYGAGWVHQGSIDPRSGNPYVDFAVNNGDSIHYAVSGSTNSGRRDFAFTMVIFNGSSGWTQLSNHRVTTTVDADNNYNVVDVTPDVIGNWPAISGSVNENDYTWSTSWYGEHYVTGISQNITARFEVYDYSGNMDAMILDVFTMAPGGSTWDHRGSFNGHVNGSDGLRKLDVVVSNGMRIAVNPRGISNSGARSCLFRLVVWSLDGNMQFANSVHQLTVDANNDWNIGGGVAPRDWNDIYASYWSTNGSSSTPNWQDGNTHTIAGLGAGQTATITLTGSASGSAMGFVELYKNGVNQGTKLYSPEGTENVTTYAGVTVQNGDTIRFRGGVGGRNASQWDTPVSQEVYLAVNVYASPGGLLDTFGVNGSYTDQWSSGGGGGPIEIS